MIQNVNPAAQMFLANVSQLQTEINQETNQVSSGLRISQPSDAPGDLVTLMGIRSQLDANTQVVKNLAQFLSHTQTAEQALEAATHLMDQATSLATQGAGSLATAAQRTALAQQVTGILQQLVGLSNTQVQGLYLFSGDQVLSPSYALNAASPTGVSSLLVSPAATQQIAGPNGITFPAGLTAQQIFDHRNPDTTPASDNIFAAVNGLLVSLQSNDQAGVAAALTSLQAASGHLSTQLSFYGSLENGIQDAQNLAGQQQTQLQAQLSQTQDADVVQLAIQLTEDQTRLQASLAAEARLPRTSLFDFLG